MHLQLFKRQIRYILTSDSLYACVPLVVDLLCIISYSFIFITYSMDRRIRPVLHAECKSSPLLVGKGGGALSHHQSGENFQSGFFKIQFNITTLPLEHIIDITYSIQY